MRKFFTLLPLMALMFFTAHGQVRPVQGRITDTLGLPIEGASIQIKGQDGGTVADSHGLFTLKLKKGDVVIVSAIGFIRKEVRTGTQTSLAVSLEKSSGKLDDVLITTALGIKRTRNSLDRKSVV